MKKIGTILGLILIFILLSLTISGSGETKNNDDNVVYEEEIVLENWMTKPFVIDTTNKENV